MDIDLKPIGAVINDIKEPRKGDWDNIVSEIIIDKAFEQALEQIEEFSHIVIIYWMNQLSPSKRSTLKVHPRGKQDLPLVGVLATRSPARPNPLGISTVKLLERNKNVLKVIGLDAINGTPIIDIKPYIPIYDSPTEVKTPAWITSANYFPDVIED